MNAALAQFHFLRPWWLLLLLAWPVLLWWLMRGSGRGRTLARLVDAALLPHVVEAAGRHQRWLWLLPAAAALLLTLALAGPAWQKLPQPLHADRTAQVVALSLSPRMLATDVDPNRLTLARYKVRDLLAANASGRNGLIAYAGASFVVAPLTTDVHALGALLAALKPDVMPVAGDRPEHAIAQGVALLAKAATDGGSLVLVTDEADDAAVAAARRARAAGIRVSVLGVGTAAGAPIPVSDGDFLKDGQGRDVIAHRDASSLRAVASAGGGIYTPMTTSDTDIRRLAAELHAGPSNSPLSGMHADRWRDFGPWLLLPLLPLVALAFRRGWMLAIPLLIAPLWPGNARAAGPPQAAPIEATARATPTSVRGDDAWHQRFASLWLNHDQRAERALSAGDARRAETLASDPALRGAAAYRAGDYETATKAFAHAPGSDGAYDRGNALVKLGRYEDAIKAYSQALKLDPHNADAEANRAAVENWLQKQKRKLRMHGGEQHHSSPGVASKEKQAKHSFKSNMKGNQDSSSSVPPMKSPSNLKQRVQAMGAQSAPGGQAQGPLTARRQQEQAARATKALKAAMDRKLARQKSTSKPYELGRVPSSEGSSGKLPPLMKRQLHGIPDDPGGFLRRKFALEHQLRELAMTGKEDSK